MESKDTLGNLRVNTNTEIVEFTEKEKFVNSIKLLVNVLEHLQNIQMTEETKMDLESIIGDPIQISNSLNILLSNIKNLEGESLKNMSLSLFSNGKAHRIYNSLMLLNWYFENSESRAMLKEYESAAVEFTKTFEKIIGCKVYVPKKFESIDDFTLRLHKEIQGGNFQVETEPVYPSARNNKYIKGQVIEELQNNFEQFIVDCRSFPYIRAGRFENRGRVSLVNPSAWSQA